MIGNESIKLSIVFVGQVFSPYNVECHAEILHAGGQPFGAFQLAIFPEKPVYLIFMNDFLQP